jgi:hypothetical protein
VIQFDWNLPHCDLKILDIFISMNFSSVKNKGANLFMRLLIETECRVKSVVQDVAQVVLLMYMTEASYILMMKTDQ